MSKFILRMKDMTAKSDADLCPSCSYLTMRKDQSGEVRTCSMFDGPDEAALLTSRVTDCTDFYPKSLPSLRDMTLIAWDITTNKKTGKMGFITPADRRAKNRDMDVPEWD